MLFDAYGLPPSKASIVLNLENTLVFTGPYGVVHQVNLKNGKVLFRTLPKAHA